MNGTINNFQVITKLLSDFRYDLIKVLVFLIILTAIVIFSNTESEKYYPVKKKNSALIRN